MAKTISVKHSKNRILRTLNYLFKLSTLIVLGALIIQINDGRTDPLFASYFLYISIGVIVVSIILIVKLKSPVYLIDAIGYALFLQCWLYINNNLFSIFVIVGLIMNLLREIYVFIDKYLDNKYRYKFYLAKMSLDMIDDGLAIQGGLTDEFQNVEFQRLLQLLKINQYNTAQNIWKIIENSEKIDRYDYDENSYIIKINEDFYIFRKSSVGKYFEIITYCINREVEARKNIKNNYLLEQEQNKTLKEYIKNIKEVEKNNLINQTKNKLHNLLGQRMSIIQCVLNNCDNDEKYDFKTLKNEMNNTLSDIEKESIIDFQQELNNLIATFKMVGFDIEIKEDLDDFNSLQNKYFIDIIRESATNSLRHAKAGKLFIDIIRNKNIEIYFYDDKKVCLSKLDESTGIKAIKNDVKELNGKIEITFQDGFMIKIVI